MTFTIQHTNGLTIATDGNKEYLVKEPECERMIEFIETGFSQYYKCEHKAKYSVIMDDVNGEPGIEELCGIHLRGVKALNKRRKKVGMESNLKINQILPRSHRRD